MKYRVGYLGFYGGTNLGDEAILEVILKEMRAEVRCRCRGVSCNAEDTGSGRKSCCSDSGNA